MNTYENRVRELEAEGLTTSDTQAIADVEAEKIRRWNAYPDLLAACKNSLEWWHSIPKHFDMKEPSFIKIISAAIAKADGE